MNYISFFMDSISAANRMKAQSPLQGLETAERLISKHCDGDLAARRQQSAFEEDSPTAVADAGSLDVDSVDPRTDIIESLAVANSMPPKSPQDPVSDVQPELFTPAELKRAETRDRK